MIVSGRDARGPNEQKGCAMKRKSLLVFAAAMAAGVIASLPFAPGWADGESSPIFGVTVRLDIGSGSWSPSLTNQDWMSSGQFSETP